MENRRRIVRFSGFPMEKRRKIEAILPQEIIQHIQSFLSAKEAAQTAILSKSWYTAWLTRPNLDFSDLDISPPSSFEDFAKKTLQRYDVLNIKIHSFRLEFDDNDWACKSTAKELIVKATKLGTSDFSLISRNPDLRLPQEVLQSETLVKLSLQGCQIYLENQKVCWPKLKSLSLCRVFIMGSTFLDMISMCPLVEELVLSQCVFMEGKKLEGVCDFHKLKVLCLKEVVIGEWFFRDLSRFSCLRELTLEDCFGSTRVQICSNSLESISITQNIVFIATFDVPRIRKFKFSGSCLPSLSFRTIPTERDWESDITIMIDCSALIDSWFREFREFLHRLSPSKISLYLSMRISCSYYDIGGITCLSKPPIVVEKLTLVIDARYSLRYALEDGLFRCCRPSLVNLYWLPKWCKKRKAKNSFTELLYKTLTEECGKKRMMSAMHDLEEVNVEFFEDDFECWGPLSCKTLLEAKAEAYYFDDIKLKVCLQLRWGSCSCGFCKWKNRSVLN